MTQTSTWGNRRTAAAGCTLQKECHADEKRPSAVCVCCAPYNRIPRRQTRRENISSTPPCVRKREEEEEVEPPSLLLCLPNKEEEEEEVKKKKPVCVREGGPPAECLSEPCVKARLDVHTRGKSWKPDWTPKGARRKGRAKRLIRKRSWALGSCPGGGGHGTRRRRRLNVCVCPNK